MLPGLIQKMFKKEDKITEARRQEILLKIKPIIAKELGIKEENITLEAKIEEDLGADSLDAIEVIMDLEEAFNIEIMDEDTEKMKTIDDIVRYLTARLI